MQDAGQETKNAWVRMGQFFFKYRDALFPILFLILLLVFKPWQPGKLFTPLDWLAYAVGFLGEGIRILTIGLTYIERCGINKEVHAKRLVKVGLYTHCRNPFYIGNLLLVLSLLILCNRFWIYILGGLFFVVVYKSIVAAEEAYLLQTFGSSYAEYCKTTPRWLPKNIASLSQTLKTLSFNWRRVVIREYSSFYCWGASVLGILMFRVISGRGLYPGLRHSLPLFLILFAITLTILLIRFLKKKHIIREDRIVWPHSA